MQGNKGFGPCTQTYRQLLGQWQIIMQRSVRGSARCQLLHLATGNTYVWSHISENKERKHSFPTPSSSTLWAPGICSPGVPQGLKSGHTWHTVAFAVWKNQFCCKQWPKNAVMPELHHLYTQTPDLRDARDRQGNEIIDFSFSLLFILYFKESFHVNSS